MTTMSDANDQNVNSLALVPRHRDSADIAAQYMAEGKRLSKRLLEAKKAARGYKAEMDGIKETMERLLQEQAEAELNAMGRDLGL